MPDLDDRLRATRDRLLADIDQPDLHRITVRAAGRRRRRTAGRAGAVLLTMVALAAGLTQPWRTDPARVPADPATVRPTPEAVSTDAGITVNGLLPGQRIIRPPGEVREVEFTDPDRGYALAVDCAGTGTCRLSVSGTEDGGVTWVVRPIDGVTVAAGATPDLVLLDARTVLVHTTPPQLSRDGGRNWQAVATGPQPATVDGDARLVLRRGPGDGCTGGVLEIWSPTTGYRGTVVTAPPVALCWLAATPAPGGWWVGGTDPATGQPAAALTRDGGRTWKLHHFPGTGGWVQISALGGRTYAAVLSRDGDRVMLRAIYHATGDGPFTRTWAGGTAPGTLGGDLVPLLDGRLLLVDGQDRWYVSEDDGRTFPQARELPGIGRLQRTGAGYLAYDIVVDGWMAYSSDGATWRKLHLN